MLSEIRKMKRHHQVLFSIMIGFAIVAFWRGAWGIMDVYLFPDSYALSSWLSLVLGVTILTVAHYTKGLM